MPGKRSRVFSRGFKLAAVSRMEAGENVSSLARELGVRRNQLYKWRDQLDGKGEDAAFQDFRGQYTYFSTRNSGDSIPIPRVFSLKTID